MTGSGKLARKWKEQEWLLRSSSSGLYESDVMYDTLVHTGILTNVKSLVHI